MACPRPRLRGEVTDTGTGEVREVRAGCDRWSCPACGPQRLRRHMAHFRDAWSASRGPLVFATLTLRPEDLDGTSVGDQVRALRTLFARLVRRVGEVEGARPRYVGQVDAATASAHRHLHAVLETGLAPAALAALWVELGGGLDHDVRGVRPTARDVGRVAGYVVKGSRWPGHGRLMVSRGLGYGSAEAVAGRRAWRDRAYGERTAHEVFEPAARPERPARPDDGDRAPDPPPFESAGPVPGRLWSAVRLRGGAYGVETTYDAAAGLARIAAVRDDGRLRRRRLAEAPSKVHACRFLRRYDARRRRRRWAVAAPSPVGGPR